VNGESTEVLTNVTTGASATSTGNYQNQVSGHDQNYDLTFTAGMLKIEAPLVDQNHLSYLKNRANLISNLARVIRQPYQ
jgi:hypothetical protein